MEGVTGMYLVELYLRVRRACMVDGMSIREASRMFGVHRDTVRKMLENPVPPGYRMRRPRRRPKLEGFTEVIDRILRDDLGQAEEAASHRKAYPRASEG